LCNPENADSWRLLERLGMRREGFFRKKAFFRTDEAGNPLWHDAYEYAVLEESWFNMHGR
jgi:RimJ/RimL family protein N-acetyltransferase